MNEQTMTPHWQRIQHDAAATAAEQWKVASSKPAADPWQHRSDGMKCRTCMWFVEKPRDPAKMAADPRGHLGRCRRHAPTMNGFPAVFTSDWCGDHKMDETKI